MIAKLVKAGYLRPEHRQDADAITSAIANMKQALRSGGSDGPARRREGRSRCWGVWATVMPRIMIRCPTADQPVPTGLTTEIIILDTLETTLSMRCPACRRVHRWRRKDAWIEEQEE